MTRGDYLGLLAKDNVQGFLRLIREGETNQNEDAYSEMYGGDHFTSFADHPRLAHTAHGFTSTAAGAYQFLAKTWDGIVKALGPMDFSPQSQDVGAVYLINGRGALQDVLNGRINDAIRKCAKEWASLPGSQYGQPTQALARALSVYQGYGGALQPGAAPAPGAETPVTTTEAKPMGPFVLPFLEAISSFVPQLVKLGFGSGSEVAQRNVAAGAVVADAVVKAVGAGTKEEALEKIQNDSEAQQAAKDAVENTWDLLTEAGGGGIAGARSQSLAPQPPLYEQGAFWVTLILASMVFMLLADVFYVHPDAYDTNLRTQIVTALLMIIGIVSAYWLGSTFGSQKKDAALALK